MSRFTDLLKFGDVGGLVAATTTFGVVPLSLPISQYAWLMPGYGAVVPINRGRFRLAATSMNALARSIRHGQTATTAANPMSVGTGHIIRRGNLAGILSAVQQYASGGYIDNRPWTPADLSTAPYVEVDPSTAVWSGSDLTSLSNAGSIGGEFSKLNTPTKASADANGHDALAFSSSALYLPSPSIPAGDLIFFYVVKDSGTPPNGVGMLAMQMGATPGWYLADQINTSGSLSTGHTYNPGDRAFNGWPSGTTASDHDIMVTPPASSGYRLTTVRVGSSTYWSQNGTLIPPNFSATGTQASSSADLYIGSSGSNGSYHWFGHMAYFAILPASISTSELQKLQGWAAWQFGTVDDLDDAHPFKLSPPVVGGDPASGGWDTTALQASDMVFSNDNRTVYGNNQYGYNDWACYSLAARTSGKWFASVSIDTYEYGDVSVTDAEDHNYVHYAWDGTIWSSAGSVLANLAAYDAPAVIDMAFDLDAHLVWFRLNGGDWNGNPANDPATGTGGFALPASALPYHVKASMPYFKDSTRTLNTGTAAFTYAPPAGFSPLAA